LARLLGACLTLGSLGCQAVLGDFQIEPQPAAEPSGLGTACEPSELRCNGATLETCAPDRRGFTPLAHCATAGQCDATAGTCRACTPGEAACNGSMLQLCNPAGELEDAQDCQTSALCHLDGDRSAASCIPPLCNRGDFSCDVNRLLECATGRDHWELVARCAASPQCDPERARDQRAAGTPPTCLPPLCLPGSFACDGAALARCSADQDAWEPLLQCADAASCNPLAGSCTSGADGSTACSGADLVRKGTGGFEKVKTCDSALLCDAEAEGCEKSSCGAAGSLRCSAGELPALEECSADGSWITREVCDHRTLCDAAAGRCFPRACDDDATRCVGNAHQTCSADRTRWETDRTCADGEVCNVLGCEPDGCTPGAVRCVAESLEACNAGHWEPRLHCATPALCSASQARCDPPVCGGSLGDYSCMPARETLLRCDPSRGAWTDFRDCTAPTPVCNADRPVNGGIPVCNACEPLAYACSGTSLTRCAADGLSSPTIASCPSSCVVSSGVPSCH